MPNLDYYPGDSVSQRKAREMAANPAHQTSWRNEGLKGIALEYLERDVLSLRTLLEKYASVVYERFGVNVNVFITNSQMGWTLFTSMLKETVISPSFREYDSFFACVYGGRCYPAKTYYQSNQYEEILAKEKQHEEIEDYLLDLDVNR